MKRVQNKRHLSNEGFSLMELLVTMLISAAVTAAMAGFLSIGLRYYHNADSETRLQTESQVAELFLTELIQEADEFRRIDDTAYPEGVTQAYEVKRKLNPADKDEVTISVVALKGEQLWFGNVSEGTDVEKLQALIDKGLEGAFLANHVTLLELTPGNQEDAIKDCNGLVQLRVNYQVSNRTYDGNSTIMLRNNKRN